MRSGWRLLNIMDMIMRLKKTYLNVKFFLFLKIFLLIFIYLTGNLYCQGSRAYTNVNLENEVMDKLQEVISPITEYLEIKQVKYNRTDDTWHIEGYSKTMETIFGYVIPTLDISDYFQNVKFIKEGFSRLEDNRIKFLLSVELREPFEVIPAGSGKIRGRVVEIESRKPIVNAKFRFMLDGNKYTQYAITDEEGVFMISIEPGEYYIVGEEVKPISYKESISDSTKASLSGPGTKQKIIVEEDKIVDIKYPIQI